MCSCGNLRSVCSDPSIDWHPQTSVCYASASVAWGQRRLREKHPKVPDGKSESLHPLDGVSVWVTDVELDDDGSFDLGAAQQADSHES